MKKDFEVGATYNAIFHGQIRTFTFDEYDAEDSEVIWITWSTGEQEGYSLEEIVSPMEEYETICEAGVIYPKGKSQNAQAEGLAELMATPTYIFAGATVPRSFVLTDHFSPNGYRSDCDYMSFIFDSNKQLLTMTTPDHEAAVPQWLIDRLPIAGIMKVDPSKISKNAIFLIQLDL